MTFTDLDEQECLVKEVLTQSQGWLVAGQDLSVGWSLSCDRSKFASVQTETLTRQSFAFCPLPFAIELRCNDF